TPSHSLSREDPWPAVLRRIGARDPRDAAGGMRGRRRRFAHRTQRHRNNPRRSLSHRDRQGRLHRAGFGARDRWPLNSKDGRDRLRLRGRAALRSGGHRAAARPGAVESRRRDARTLPNSCRRFGGRGGLMRPRQFSRKHFIHASRSVRSCDFADFVVLAGWRHAVARPCAFTRYRKFPRGLKTVLAEVIPTRLAHAVAGAAASNLPIANIPDRSLSELADRLRRWQLKPTGSEGWAKAEVTVCGIDTAALSSKTMEARAVPGLYAIGEAVDVTGWLGGYNFQWAWSSGWCAGQAVEVINAGRPEMARPAMARRHLV